MEANAHRNDAARLRPDHGLAYNKARFALVEGHLVPRIGGGGSSGGGGGGQQQQTKTETVTKSDPWAGQQPYLTTGFQQAQEQVLNRPLEYFPGATTVPYSPETELALALQTNRAVQGSSDIAAGRGELQRTLGGDYLNQGNPYMGAVTDRIAGDVGGAVDARYAGAGRMGVSPGQTEAVSRGIAEGVAPFQFGAYEGERGRMMNALEAAPSYAAQDYIDLAALGEVGGAREALAGEKLQEDIARYTFGELEPTQRITQFMNLVGGNYGGQSQSVGTSTSPTRGGGSGAALGTAALIGSQFIPSPKPTVVCTAYWRRGWLLPHEYEADGEYGRKVWKSRPMAMIGYWAWARPLAAKIETNGAIAWILWPLARPIIREITRRGGHACPRNRLAAFALDAGLELCERLGRRLMERKRHAHA